MPHTTHGRQSSAVDRKVRKTCFAYHSPFKLLFADAVVDGSTCSVRAESERAKGFPRANLTIWDEIPKPLILPFKTSVLVTNPSEVLLSFSQATGDKSAASYKDGVDHSLISSALWPHFKRFRLTASMSDRHDKPHTRTVRAVGEGSMPCLTLQDDREIIPLQYKVQNGDGTTSTCTVSRITDFEKLVDHV